MYLQYVEYIYLQYVEYIYLQYVEYTMYIYISCEILFHMLLYICRYFPFQGYAQVVSSVLTDFNRWDFILFAIY